MSISGQRSRQFPRLAPCLALVVGEDHEGIELAAVLAQQHRDLLAVRRAQCAGFAEMSNRMLGDDLRLRPSQAAVRRDDLVDLKLPAVGIHGRIAEPAPVVMEQRHVGTVLEFHHGGHRDDAAIARAGSADRLQRRPRAAFVQRVRHADAAGLPRKHQDPRNALRVDQAEQRGHLHRRGPVLRSLQSVRPGEAAVEALLVDDGALAVPLGIGDQDGLVVGEEQGRGVPEILAGLPVNHHLAMRLGRQVDGRDGVTPRRLVRCRNYRCQR